MTNRPKGQQQVSDLWLDLCEKILAELKQRGFDVDNMSEAEFADLLKRLAEARPDVTRRKHRSSV